MIGPVVAAVARLPELVAQHHGDREPEEETDPADEHGRELEASLAAAHARGDERDRQRRDDQPQRTPRDADEADEDRDGREEAGDRLRRAPPRILVQNLALSVQRSAILSARAAAARAVRA